MKYTLSLQCGSVNSDDLLSRSGGTRAGIPVVVASGNGKVRTRLNSLVSGLVQRLGKTITQRHVGNGSLMSCLSECSKLDLAVYSATHKTPPTTSAAVLLPLEPKVLMAVRLVVSATPVFAVTDSTGAVGAMDVAILVCIILRDGRSPGGATFKPDTIDTGIDEVLVNTLKPVE